MIVVTAGHIDHGKTSLIASLTGVDTDRLPQEKARGMSLDLGYAYHDFGSGGLVGFVDVPGHVKYLRNMLAGMALVDMALLVVACDDGLMPQTIEHLEILQLLQVPRVIVVLTKVDRVDEAVATAAETNVRAELNRRGWRNSAAVRVSNVTGEGVAALRDLLVQAGREVRARSLEGHARLAVDRSFSVKGIGTVVTGAMLDGALRPGAMVRVVPQGIDCRLKAIHCNGRPVDRAVAGQRFALQLAGVVLRQVERGSWIVEPPLGPLLGFLYVRLRWLHLPRAGLKRGAEVRLHHGTAETTARIRWQGPAQPAIGDEGFATLELARPVPAIHADRFILRDGAGSMTLAGGTVLDGAERLERRLSQQRLRQLDAWSASSRGACVKALLACSEWVDRSHLRRMFNLTDGASRNLLALAQVEYLDRAERFCTTRTKKNALTSRLLATLRRHHAQAPKEPGLRPSELRRQAVPMLPDETVEGLLHEMQLKGLVRDSAGQVCLPTHKPLRGKRDEGQWGRLLQALEQSVWPVRLADLAARSRLDPRTVQALMEGQAQPACIVATPRGGALHRRDMLRCVGMASEVADLHPQRRLEVGAFRDRLGTNRQRAVEILETLDAQGYTARLGEARVVLSPADNPQSRRRRDAKTESALA